MSITCQVNSRILQLIYLYLVLSKIKKYYHKNYHKNFIKIIKCIIVYSIRYHEKPVYRDNIPILFVQIQRRRYQSCSAWSTTPNCKTTKAYIYVTEEPLKICSHWSYLWRYIWNIDLKHIYIISSLYQITHILCAIGEYMLIWIWFICIKSICHIY